ncbi:MAG: hypothetical protein M0Q94_10215 [Candidatus Cloacimonetes bacterium]|nr:hypothetical protein [Candidatus Cloacimonadota bacterium]
MNTLRFGIYFIDNHLNDLLEQNIYSIYEEIPSVKHIFIKQLIDYNLSTSHSVLYLTNLYDTSSNKVVSQYINIDKNIKINKENKNLLILEIPRFLSLIVKDTFDMNHILNDLKIYIDYQKPDLIILQDLHLLFPSTQDELNTTFLSQFLNFINHEPITVLLDLSSLSFKFRNICEKFISASFEIQKSSQNSNYHLSIKKFKNTKQQLPIVFTIDLNQNITPSIFKNKPYVNLNECKHILLKKGFESYESFFQKIISQDIRFSYYDDTATFKQITFNEYNTLVIIPSNVSNLNGWQFISWVRRNYPLCSILMVGSINIPACQKVRAIRIGADKVINFPIIYEELKDAIETIYHSEEIAEDYSIRHNILFINKEFKKYFMTLVVSKNPFIRILKEYVMEILQDGYSLQFFKIKVNVNSLNEINDSIKEDKDIIFISTLIINQAPYIVFIFKNLTFSKIKYFKQQIAYNFKQFKKDIPMITNTNNMYNDFINIKKDNLLTQETDVYTDDIFSKNYPFEETDIDNIITWIYEK